MQLTLGRTPTHMVSSSTLKKETHRVIKLENLSRINNHGEKKCGSSFIPYVVSFRFQLGHRICPKEE